MLKIYGTQKCHWCTMAEVLLEENDIAYTKADVQKDEVALEFFKEKGFKSVPQIYHGDNHVGGFAELKDYIKENDL